MPFHPLTLGLKHPILLSLAVTMEDDCLKSFGVGKGGQLSAAHHWLTSHATQRDAQRASF